MRLRIASVLFAVSCITTAWADDAADVQRIQVERLAAAGRLWAAIEYFHPATASHEIDWESAWIRAYPEIRAAKTKEEYSKAIDEMLARLSDPVTRVLREPQRPADAGPITLKWQSDSVLLVTVPATPDMTGMIGKLSKSSAELEKATTIVFDIRNATDGFPLSLSLSGVEKMIVDRPLSAPDERRRFHVGLAPAAYTSDIYYSGFQVRQGARIDPTSAAKPKRLVFLVNAHTTIPPVALALQTAGTAALVAEGPVTDENFVTTTTLDLCEGLRVKMRLGELVYADGRSGFAPDETVAEGEGLHAALTAAAQPLASKRSFAVAKSSAAIAKAPVPAPEAAYPDPAFRTLAAVRIWAIHNYFYPYKKLMNEDWNRVLSEFLPKFEAAKDAVEYDLAIAEMLTHVHDAHSSAWNDILEKNLYGEAPAAVEVRFIGNVPVVTRFRDPAAREKAGVALGDIILSIDGKDVGERIGFLSRHLSASTPQALRAVIAADLLSGPNASEIDVKVRRVDGSVHSVKIPRKTEYRTPKPPPPDVIVRVLPGNIGYVNLAYLTVATVDEMFDKLRATRAIIFDMRGYPRGTAWSIAPRLTEAFRPVVALEAKRVTLAPDPAPGEPSDSMTEQLTDPLPATDKWRYTGKTVMLIDERAVSQSEHTALFFEAANGTKFVGSPTRGADGDVTTFLVPGGVEIGMTGLEVQHADGRQLQRVGLQPDVFITPTIAGIAAGRDEVLDRAVEFINTGK